MPRKEKKTEETEKKAPAEEPVVNIEAEEAKHIITPIEDVEKVVARIDQTTFDIDKWQPKTAVGKKVKAGEITDIDKILDNGNKILEAEIIDALMPNLQSDLLLIGQSKGKFGGGQRRVFRQTQKKTKEGNKPSFATYAVIGDSRGHIGLGYGKSRETVPAREKAVRKAKLNLIKIRRGCGSWQCACGKPHSIPFKVEGKCGSVKVILMPAPKGTGRCVNVEVAKILNIAGVEDVWSRTEGKTTSRINLVTATMAALKKLMSTKLQARQAEKLSVSQ
jgi:small subunit ribosomal protein S5